VGLGVAVGDVDRVLQEMFGWLQGFASGSLDDDAFAPRFFVDQGLEVMVSQSYSKNLGKLLSHLLTPPAGLFLISLMIFSSHLLALLCVVSSCCSSGSCSMHHAKACLMALLLNCAIVGLSGRLALCRTHNAFLVHLASDTVCNK